MTSITPAPVCSVKPGRSSIRNLIREITLCLGLAFVVSPALAQTPQVGDQVPDFTLSAPVGGSLTLSKEVAKGETALIVLRGYPGYQCPYCVKQVHDFVENAERFAAKNTTVIFVYPGPPAALDEHAKEFLAMQAALPSNIKLVIDPDYKMTNLYNLRWDAPHETAYPATFILAKGGKVSFEKISRGHGDRTTAAELLAQLPKQ